MIENIKFMICYFSYIICMILFNFSLKEGQQVIQQLYIYVYGYYM